MVVAKPLPFLLNELRIALGESEGNKVALESSSVQQAIETIETLQNQLDAVRQAWDNLLYQAPCQELVEDFSLKVSNG